MSTQPMGLKRALGFWALVAYGVGDILGAGIYALMGKVAGLAGQASWIAFSVSMLAAGITALTYSELVSRYPLSGGEAYHTEMGFRRRSISTVVGWLTFCSAVFSLSAISVAFAGYLGSWIEGVPSAVLIIAFLLAVGAVNYWGIVHSSATNVVFTLVEGTGLIIVVVGDVFEWEPISETVRSTTWDQIGFLVTFVGVLLLKLDTAIYAG
ncbi:MAG: amino acid permease, partial [Alphaproteobacteria bacterium]|nr:amino acid permease [Alphaproteobacteria bacterium]